MGRQRPSRSGGTVRVARHVVLAPGASESPSATGAQTSAESPGNGARTSRLRRVTLPLFRATNVYATGCVADVTVDGSADTVSASLGTWIGLAPAMADAEALYVIPSRTALPVTVCASTRERFRSTRSWVTVRTAVHVVDARAGRVPPTGTGAHVRAGMLGEALVTARSSRATFPVFATVEVSRTTWPAWSK
jgi:hypothetical protein